MLVGSSIMGLKNTLLISVYFIDYSMLKIHRQGFTSLMVRLLQ